MSYPHRDHAHTNHRRSFSEPFLHVPRDEEDYDHDEGERRGPGPRGVRHRSKSRTRGSSGRRPITNRASSNSSLAEQLADLWDKGVQKVSDNPDVVIAATAATAILGNAAWRKWEDGTIQQTATDFADRVDEFTGHTSLGKGIRRLSSDPRAQDEDSRDGYPPELPHEGDYGFLQDEGEHVALQNRLRRNSEHRRKSYEQPRYGEATLEDHTTSSPISSEACKFGDDGYSADGRRYNMNAVKPESSGGKTTSNTSGAQGISYSVGQGPPLHRRKSRLDDLSNRSMYVEEENASEADSDDDGKPRTHRRYQGKDETLTSFPAGSTVMPRGGSTLRKCRGDDCSRYTKDRVETDETRQDGETVTVARPFCATVSRSRI